MSERFRSPLEAVTMDEKAMWLAHPVTKELIKTIDLLRAARAKSIVTIVCSSSLDVDILRYHGAAISALEQLKEHILFAGVRNVAS